MIRLATAISPDIRKTLYRCQNVQFQSGAAMAYIDQRYHGIERRGSSEVIYVDPPGQ
jgi:hypothetical protein